MVFVHTFYSTPLYENKFAKFEISLNNILWDYGVSLMFIKKFGHKIKLVTDTIGKEILSCLPYDEIIVLDNVETNKHFAASFKFYALQKCELSDILIDGDIILSHKNVYNVIKLSKHDILHSFTEKNNYIFRDYKPNDYHNTPFEYYNDLFNKINSVDNLLYSLPQINQLEYPNTSLIKINNQELKDKWINQYFYHMNLLKNIDFGLTWPDIIIEQYFLKCVINENNFTHKEIISKFPEGTKWEKDMGFTHLGNMKKQYLNNIKYLIYKHNYNLYLNIDKQIKKILSNK